MRFNELFFVLFQLIFFVVRQLEVEFFAFGQHDFSGYNLLQRLLLNHLRGFLVIFSGFVALFGGQVQAVVFQVKGQLGGVRLAAVHRDGGGAGRAARQPGQQQAAGA